MQSDLSELMWLTLKLNDKFYPDSIEWYVKSDGRNWFPYPLVCFVVMDEESVK